MKYTISYNHPEKHFIDFELSISVLKKESLVLQLPSWRPGRYELGNFAKNIKDFKILDSHNNLVSFNKKNKDSWEVNTAKYAEIIVKYSYYAAELNAGSTFLNEDQLYINPVNCMMYVEGESDLEYEISFSIDNDMDLITSLANQSKHVLKAKSFDELADSPIIASNSLQYKKREISGVDFHFCFQGEIKVDWNKVFNDFKKFIEYQITQFGTFPHQEFYFLFQITPYKSYHGVEHHKSTVILLGSSYDVFGKLYNEFLGVSSHELYHVWNIKSIRPTQMHPYEFSKENYTHLGYVAEGVTTYMGDRMLYESGVFSKEDYFKELKTLLIRHFHNDGRHHYSVAESSWDTWLDGYVAGVPGRKVSIYVEGALIAMICDAKIRKQTNHEKSLHDVMRVLYSGSNLETNYDKERYKKTLEKISGIDFTDVFNDLIYGTKDFTKYLKKAFNVFGWDYTNIPSKNLANRYGLKTLFKDGNSLVVGVLEGSAAYLSVLAKDDKLIAVNGFSINNDLESWLKYFLEDDIVLLIERESKLKEIKLGKINDFQYYNYEIKEL